MSLKDWKLIEKNSTRIAYKHKEENLFIDMKILYPSKNWNVELYKYSVSCYVVVFKDGFPYYNLSKQDAKNKIIKYIKTH